MTGQLNRWGWAIRLLIEWFTSAINRLSEPDNEINLRFADRVPFRC